MSVTPKQRWLALLVVFALTAVGAFQALHQDFGVAQHLSFVLLPYIGTLALLPSDPGAWLSADVSPVVTQEAFAPAVPPRAPPV